MENTTHHESAPGDDRVTIRIRTNGYLRLKQIIAPEGPLPISKSGFWAGVRDGRFPKPRKISSRVTVWRVEDIETLLGQIEAGTL